MLDTNNKQLKILLVRPPRIKQAVTLGEFMFAEPIGLEIVYTILKDKYQVKILDLMAIDEDYKEVLNSYKPHIVGITSLCIDVNMVLNFAKKTKEFNPEIITFAGGTQAYLDPEAFYSEYIDHVFKFTTRSNLLQLIDSIENSSRLLINYLKYSNVYSTIPLIDGIHSKVNGYKSTNKFGKNQCIAPDRTSTARYRHLYSYLGFRPCAIMQTSLGCSKNCDFCLRWRIEGHKEEDIAMIEVIDQIKSIKEPSIMIYDNDFLNNKDRLEEFCDLLEVNEIKKNFICYASVKSIISHPDTVKRVVKNGLRAVLVGYETFNQQELINYSKKSSVEDSFVASKILKEIGLDCWASFIMHPDWDAADFKSFRKYIKDLNPEISTFSPLTPFPNLPMYEEYKDRLLFSKNDYESWSFGKVGIKPSKLTLKKYYYEMLKTILYINLVTNSASYMRKRFGISTIARLGKGSMKVFFTYIRLMINAR